MSHLDTCLEKFTEYVQGASLDEKKHQLDGMRWCLKNELRTNAPEQKKGGIVADEMGLGKTIMMLGLIVSNFKTHTLIVLPLALLDQWRNEIMRTMGHEPLIFHGKEKKRISAEVLAKSPVVLTTYGQINLVKRGKDAYVEHMLHEQKWDRIIFDEAHHLRNKNTRVHKGMLELKSNIRWLVTGTPIQNRWSDFYALCAALNLSPDYYTQKSNLRELAKNFIIKLTKKEVGIELPPLKIDTVDVNWAHKSEHSIAEDIHSLLQFSQVGPRNVNNAIALMGAGDFRTLPLLVRARQACIYPPLIKKQIEDYMKAGLLEENDELLEGTTYSSKIDTVVQKIVERKDNKKNKLIFCHYRGEIDILAERLRGEKMSVHTFDGRTGHGERNIILESSVDALILQIQTGCEGLNLQQFSEIYFVSPHWNPAVEDQAIARCHRIGQTKEVNVFRFGMKPFDNENETVTLDTYSRMVQDAKRELIEKSFETDK